MEEWLRLTCYYCRTSLEIKAAYAHMRGRCPECGYRILALKPKPPPAPITSTSDEPLGLLPDDDEEWPEPARVVDDAPRPPVGSPLPSPAVPIPEVLVPEVTAAEPPAIIGFQAATARPLSVPASPPSPGGAAGFELVEEGAPPIAEGRPDGDAQTPPGPSPPSGSPSSTANADFELLDDSEPRGAATASPPPITLETDPTTFLSDLSIPAALLPKAKHVERLPDVPDAELVDGPPAPPPPSKSPGEAAAEETLALGARYSSYQLPDAVISPKRPTPPKSPFLSGIIEFPVLPENLTPFLVLFGGSFLWLILVNLLVRASLKVEAGATLYVLGMGPLALLLLLLTFWLGSWSAAYFVTTVQETAAGNPDVSWPADSWRAWIPVMFRLAFVFLFWIALPYRIFTWMELPITAYVCFGLSMIAFPLSLLCVMTSDAFYVLVNWSFLRRLFRRPRAVAALYAYWLPLGTGALVSGWLTITSFGHRLAFAVCFMIVFFVALWWAATLLILGRVVGRVGWVVSQAFEGIDERRRKRKTRRERTRPKPDAVDAEPEPRTVAMSPATPPVETSAQPPPLSPVRIPPMLPPPPPSVPAPGSPRVQRWSD